MPMRAGELRFRVAIQTLEELPKDADLGSDTTTTWTTVAMRWADIRAVKGGVYFDGQQLGNDITHTIRMRYIPLTTEHYILFHSRRFRVRFVTNVDERGEIIDLLCQEDSTVA